MSASAAPAAAAAAAPSIAHGRYPTALDLKKATILITGGSSGIGLGFARTALDAGCTAVIIAARRADALATAKQTLNSDRVHTLQGDIATAESREKLVADAIKQFPALNIVFNNAGVQRQNDSLAVTLAAGAKAPTWAERQAEIDINFGGVVHMSELFVPHLLTQPEAAIVNVSSGLAFAPAAGIAVYSATKAAVHSYTVSLRYQLAATRIRVVEFAPPAVKSNLGGAHDFGEPTNEYCEATWAKFAAGDWEIGYKFSEAGRLASREAVDGMVAGVNKMTHAQQVKQ